MVEDTSKRDPLTHMVGMLGEDGMGEYIEVMEAAGQQQLVHSDIMPAQGSDALPALGFRIGEFTDDDQLFVHATLPEGWSKEGSDHSMWSYVVDAQGRRRVSCFYKAAFYDRSAHCSVVRLASVLYDAVEAPPEDHKDPVYDLDPTDPDGWCTPLTLLRAIVNDILPNSIRYVNTFSGKASTTASWARHQKKIELYRTYATDVLFPALLAVGQR